MKEEECKRKKKNFGTDHFQLSKASFLDPSISDHCPILIKNSKWKDFGKKPFKFINAWTAREDFMDTVAMAWQMPINQGLPPPLSAVAARLKNVKRSLVDWNKSQIGDLSEQVRLAEEDLGQLQQRLILDSLNEELALREMEARKKVQRAILMEESFLKQKARVKWLRLGDKNNRFFHLSVKSHQYLNSFRSIRNSQGDTVTEPNEIKKEAELFFRMLYSPAQRMELHETEIQDLHLTRHLSLDQQQSITQSVSEDEIKRTVFAMDGSKAPGPDGFNCW